MRVFHFLLLSLIIAAPAQAELKKWVDEKGQVHYGDAIPPKYLRKEHSIMNQEGVVLEVVPAAKTAEQLREEKRQEKLAKIQAEKDRQQAFRDRVLTDTYTSEEDLLKAREERVSTFNSLIELTGTIIKSNEEQLERLLVRKAEFEKFQKELPVHMQTQEKILRQQIIDNKGYVEDQKAERERVLKQFEKDLTRFLFLKEREKQRKLEIERRRLERKKLEEELYGPLN